MHGQTLWAVISSKESIPVTEPVAVLLYVHLVLLKCPTFSRPHLKISASCFFFCNSSQSCPVAGGQLSLGNSQDGPVDGGRTEGWVSTPTYQLVKNALAWVYSDNTSQRQELPNLIFHS